ncbi:hypothetical protein ACT2CD_00655 [Candidatus Karelsulcia muelleri]
MNSFLLSNIIKKVKSSQTLIMAEQAKKLKKLGYNVRNLSIGEPDFYTQNLVLIAATKTIAEVIIHAHYWVVCNSKLKPKISNPCNTTCTVSYLEDLEVIVNIFKTNNKIIIISAERSEYQENISICSECYEKIFCLTVFSLVYGEGFSKACVKLKGKTTSVFNYIAQKAARSVVENSTKNFIKKMVKKFKNVDNKVSISTVSGSAFGTSKTNILEAFIRIKKLS